jgi:hypothetical protein
MSVIFAMILPFLVATNAVGQQMGSDSYRGRNGSHGMMGQDPDEILRYCLDMMT